MSEWDRATAAVALAKSVLAMHADNLKRIADAEASGDRKEAAQFRKLAKKTEKLINSYGLARQA